MEYSDNDLLNDSQAEASQPKSPLRKGARTGRGLHGLDYEEQMALLEVHDEEEGFSEESFEEGEEVLRPQDGGAPMLSDREDSEHELEEEEEGESPEVGELSSEAELEESELEEPSSEDVSMEEESAEEGEVSGPAGVLALDDEAELQDEEEESSEELSGSEDIGAIENIGDTGDGDADDDVSTPEFQPVELPDAGVSDPEHLSEQRVERIIGTDPKSGNTYFWGRANTRPPKNSERGQGPRAKEIPRSIIDRLSQEGADSANQQLSDFYADARARVAFLKGQKELRSQEVRQDVGAKKAELEQALGAQKLAAVTRSQTLEAQIIQDAEAAREAVRKDMEEAGTQVQEKFTAAESQISERSKGSNKEIDELAEKFEKDLKEAFSKSQKEVTKAGKSHGQKAILDAKEKHDAYETNMPGQLSGAGGLFKGKNYEINKQKARMQAATAVGQTYDEEFKKTAKEIADALSGGEKDVIEAAAETFKSARDAVKENEATALKQLKDLKEQSEKSASDFKTARIADIDKREEALLKENKASRDGAVAAFDTVIESGKKTLDATGNVVVTTLETGYDTLISGIQTQLKELTIAVESATAPPEDELLALLSEKRAFLDSTFDTEALLEAQLAASKDSLGQTVTGIVSEGLETQKQFMSRFEAIAKDSTTLRTATQEASAGEKDSILDAFDKAQQKIDDEHVKADQQVLTGLKTDVENATKNVQSNLNELVQGTQSDFSQLLSEMPAKIQSEAEIAAGKVKPAWKKLLSVIIKVIVAIAVAVALALLAASGAGLVLLILGGALIGAVGAAIPYLADCALGLKDFDGLEFFAEIVGGAVGGIIGVFAGKLGSKLGSMASKKISNEFMKKATSLAVSFFANFVANSGITMVGTITKNMVMHPLTPSTWFKRFWDSVVDNIGLNLIGAFAGNLPGMHPATMYFVGRDVLVGGGIYDYNRRFNRESNEDNTILKTDMSEDVAADFQEKRDAHANLELSSFDPRPRPEVEATEEHQRKATLTFRSDLNLIRE